MNKNILQISIVQANIEWEDSRKNLEHFNAILQKLKGKTDLVILPELFTTGFSMNVNQTADSMEGETLCVVRNWAKDYQLAIVSSFMAVENEQYHNRAFFITPEGKEYYYDKRHLFRMANEDKYVTPGQKKTIIEYLGWKITPLICYDLRFPVWSRNMDNEYDLLIYVANWPEARKKAWHTLLCARAIENQAYVCGVNRVGTDAKGFVYHGQSLLFSPEGETCLDAGQYIENVCTYQVNKEKLDTFRKRFPVWKDADHFSIQNMDTNY